MPSRTTPQAVSLLPPPTRGSGVAGRATLPGTRRYRDRFAGAVAADFYRSLHRDGSAPLASSLGGGTYLGDCDDAEDARYEAAVWQLAMSGVNLLDTAINYRCQRSERAVGRALRGLVDDGVVARDEVVVCTKGGYVPLDGTAPGTREAYRAYLDREFFGPGVMAPEDVVAGGHCLTPAFLLHQIETSRRNLGVATIDVYYVHNPEQQLDVISNGRLLQTLRAAFAALEEAAERGDIGAYGCATWNGLRVPPGTRGHLELEELVGAARDVAGDRHRFRVVQAPVNLAMTEALRAPTQSLRGRAVPLLEAASELGVSVVASASLMQSRLADNLPPEVRAAFPSHTTDAQRAIAFVRGLPVTSALVGMKSEAHVVENLGGCRG